MSTTTVLNQCRAVNVGLLTAAHVEFLTLSGADQLAVRAAVLNPANAALYGWLQSAGDDHFVDNIFPGAAPGGLAGTLEIGLNTTGTLDPGAELAGTLEIGLNTTGTLDAGAELAGTLEIGIDTTGTLDP